MLWITVALSAKGVIDRGQSMAADHGSIGCPDNTRHIPKPYRLRARSIGCL